VYEKANSTITMRTLCIGISIGISLVHIFSTETIAMWVAIAFLALASIFELVERKKKK